MRKQSQIIYPGKLLTKTLFIFFGSLSALQEFEYKLVSNIKPKMTKEKALATARKLAKECGVDWDFDLDVKIIPIDGLSKEEFSDRGNRIIEDFERAMDFEQYDGSGNARGYTSFIL